MSKSPIFKSSHMWAFIVVLTLIVIMSLQWKGASAQQSAGQTTLDEHGRHLEDHSDRDVYPGRSPDKGGSPQKVLWNNGPIITCAGCGANTADVSEMQTELGLATIGFTHGENAGARIADDFTISDPAGWTIEKLRFFSFQTGSGTTSTVIDVQWSIYDRPPSGGRLARGHGLNDTRWTGIYRASDANISDVSAPIMQNTVDIDSLFLPAGTYWISWQTKGTLPTDAFSPPISIKGQSTTGNGRRVPGVFNTWAPAKDQGTGTPQGFPFIIEGKIGRSLVCNEPAVTFDNKYPHDWRDVTPIGSVVWSQTGDSVGCDVPYELGGTAPGACANADTTNSAANLYDAQLLSNSFDLSGVTIAHLELDYRHRPSGSSQFDIDISTNGGNSWTNIFSDKDGNPSGAAGDFLYLDLDQYLDRSNVTARFRYHGDDHDWYAQLDNVRLTCSSDPNPDIYVDPVSIALTQSPDNQAQMDLTISNVGGSPLDWQIDESRVTNCSSPLDIPWASVAPANGTVPVSGTASIDVTFDSTGLPIGKHNGLLCIISNDPDPGPGNGTNYVVVQLEHIVEQPAANNTLYLPALASSSP